MHDGYIGKEMGCNVVTPWLVGLFWMLITMFTVPSLRIIPWKSFVNSECS